MLKHCTRFIPTLKGVGFLANLDKKRIRWTCPFYLELKNASASAQLLVEIYG